MRKPVIAGNWKMNNTVEEARRLIFNLILGLRDIKGVEKVIFPPYLSILPAAALLEGTDIGLGAQDLHWEAKGAFTGEISAEMIAEFCQYVLIGHSERRIFFGESDEAVNKKIFAAISNNLIPIVCIGETINEKESGQTGDILEMQLRKGLMDLPDAFISSVILAYEPVWAIGTGRASSGIDARDVIRDMIRPVLLDMFGENVKNSTRVLYGGSVTGANASEFLDYDDIDGALVGGASLKADEFVKIAQAGAG
ncbi:MAG: triose-phosphate isomerase [Chloroflexota bacterium]